MRRPNLEVRTETLALRVLFDGRRAVGVETERDGVVARLGANREVVLAGGTFHSPHILMHSGIGNESALRELGITPVHDLPAVGRHLKDHPSTPIAMDMKDSTSYGLSWKALPRDIVQLFQYFLLRSGPLSSNLFETNAYIRTSAAVDRPDMQLVFQPARRNLKPFPIPLGHGYAIAAVCLYPKSEGSVSLADPDPHTAPLIDPALGSNPADLEFLVKGLKLARKVFAHESFRRYGAHEREPGPHVVADEALMEYVRNTLVTVHHPGSTCRMGPAGDNVVDHELRVHGLEALRVADASIYPRLVGANTNASVVAIAEKASDMLLGKAPPGQAAT
jgi:choline dehydrogenase-like flavoprotein